MIQQSSPFNVANESDHWFPARVLFLAIAFMVFAVILRWPVIGDPVVHIDEEFYHLVGTRMLQGAVPYVDIWDRKPIGLFLIFYAIAAAFGTSVIPDQILAILAVTSAALLVFTVARAISTRTGALLAGLLYISFLDLAGGEACQAPVWYNPLVLGAVAIIFSARKRMPGSLGDFRIAGMVAMALFGVAIQIKYSAIFEGVFVGSYLIVSSKRRGRPFAALMLDTLAWIAAALAPTAMAALFYHHIGHFNDWFYANFISILHRGVEPLAIVRWRLFELTLLISPLAIALPIRALLREKMDVTVRDDTIFVDAWALSAIAGVLVFGTWYNHYALPLFAPLSIAAAPLATVRHGKVYLAAALVASTLWGEHILHRHLAIRGDARLLARVTDAMSGYHGCLFVYDGFVASYEDAHSCLPTSHVFPGHFAGKNEIGATGIAEAQVVRNVMRTLPERVTSMEPGYPNENATSRAAFYNVIQSRYRELARFRRGDRWLVVYGLSGRSAISY